LRISRAKQFFITFAAFFVLGVAFKVMVLVEGLTEVRPVNAIPPVAGLVFGSVGALACGLGNVAADLFGSFGWTSALGFVGNVMAAWLPYKLWHSLSDQAPNLHSGKNILLYIAISLVNAFTTAWILSFGLYLFFGMWIETMYTYVFFNNFGFSVMLGMPLLIIFSSDSVMLNFAPAPGSLLKTTPKLRLRVSVAYTVLMAIIFVNVIVFHIDPARFPALWLLSGLALAGLTILVV
jgi:energy-coupling factor transport system substrate-specific component